MHHGWHVSWWILQELWHRQRNIDTKKVLIIELFRSDLVFWVKPISKLLFKHDKHFTTACFPGQGISLSESAHSGTGCISKNRRINFDSLGREMQPSFLLQSGRTTMPPYSSFQPCPLVGFQLWNVHLSFHYLIQTLTFGQSGHCHDVDACFFISCCQSRVMLVQGLEYNS